MHLKHFHSLSSEWGAGGGGWGGGGVGGGGVGGGGGGGEGVGGPDWALLLEFSELLFAWADVLLLFDECFVLLPFSSTELL